MNKLRKLLVLLLAVTSVFVGCDRNSTNTSAIRAGDTIQGEGFTFVAPDSWNVIGGSEIREDYTLYKVGKPRKVINIYKVEAPEYEGLSAKDLERSIKENFNVLGESTLNKIEVITMPYGDVVYDESTTEPTQENQKISFESTVAIRFIKDKYVYIISATAVGGEVSDICDEALFVAENITFN